MRAKNRLDRLEKVLRPKDDREPQKMADLPPTPRTVEEWNRIVAWHMGKSDGSDIEPAMKRVWDEWETRHPAAGT